MSSLQLVPCPLCREEKSFLDVSVPDTDLHLQKYGDLYAGVTISSWKICGRCGFVHQNPRPTIAALNDFYMRSAYHAEVQDTAEQHLRFAHWYFDEKIDYCLARSGLENGSVFDIGAGLGGVLRLYQDRGWQTLGVEPDRAQVQFATEKLGVRGVRHGLLDENIELPQQVDLCVSNHAFEHFADLDGVMKGVRKVLRPGGYLFIVIPTYRNNKSSLSRRWMNSAHYSLFTHQSLAQLSARHGFSMVDYTYHGWWKEHDDLWFLARRTDGASTPESHYEDPREVERYLSFVNPMRSLLMYPVYSHWPQRVRIFTGLRNRAGRLLGKSRRPDSGTH